MISEHVLLEKSICTVFYMDISEWGKNGFLDRVYIRLRDDLVTEDA